jgi:polygalacturonase
MRILTLVLLGAECLAVGQSTALPPIKAVPANYGYPVPNPEPSLPSGTDTFEPPHLGTPGGPPVGEWTRSGSPDDTITLAGPSFGASTYFCIFGQAGNQTTEVDRSANIADATGATVTLPSALPAWSMYLIWPVTQGTYGMPVAVNRTEAWWIGPEQGVPGDTVYVYGRNLSKHNSTQTSSIYIKPVGISAGRYATVTSVNPYRVGFTVPELPVDSYEVWVHNNHGGHLGWSGPLAFSVVGAAPFAGQSENLYSVVTYGAKGDGQTDDAAAIQQAQAAAAAHAPAAIYFPPGTYVVNSPLSLSDHVSWVGHDTGSSIIEVGPGFEATGAFAFISDGNAKVGHVQFANLTIDGHGNLGPGNNVGAVLFDVANHDYIDFTDVTLNYKQQTFANGTPSCGLALQMESNTHLSMENSVLVGCGIFFGTSSRVSIDSVNFVLTDSAPSTIGSWGGTDFSVTNSTVQNYDNSTGNAADAGERFFTSGGVRGSLSNFYFAGNQTIQTGPIPADQDQNAGEQILFETPSISYSLSPISATANTITFSTALAPSEWSQDAFVVQGRGVGQARHISSVNGATITVDAPWAVAPDTTSLVNIGSGQSHTVVYNNSLTGHESWESAETASMAVEMFGNSWSNIVANNTVSAVRRDIGVWAIPNTVGIAPSYFNLVTNNTMSGAYDGLYLEFGYGGFFAGSVGQFGNTYRYNSLSNIMEDGVVMGLRVPCGDTFPVGGDFEHEVLEHNSITNGPQVEQQGVYMDPSTGFTEVHYNAGLEFLSTVLYKNTFNRGSGPLQGSMAFNVPNDGVETFFRASDQWLNYQNSTTDPNAVPAPTPALAPR